MFLYLRTLHEEQPGEHWKETFDRTWPFYKKWFLQEGYSNRPGYLTSIQQLEKHMPELMPIYESLCDIVDAGDVEARFLTQFEPPPFMSGCSQIAWTRDANMLIRNYDYSPRLFEGVMLRSNWLKRVIGISDCMWGLLDGMNEDGLVVSLTFGGRNVSGHGFGIPLVLRYVLETCSNVSEAIKVLERIPVHMTYNITLLDEKKNFCTVFVAPDRPTSVIQTPIGTNHQHTVEWNDYAQMSGTLPRMQFLQACLANPYETKKTLKRKFHQRPLYNTQFEKGFGTLYTAVYDIESMSCQLRWPNKKRIYSFTDFSEEKLKINLSKMYFDQRLSM